MAPRRCPSEVITQRIELGTAERQQVKKIATAYKADKFLENIPNIMLGVAGVGAAVALPIMAYQIGLGIANAVPFDDGAAADKYQELVKNNIIRPLKGELPLDPSVEHDYPDGLPVVSYSVTAKGVQVHVVPRWARVIGVGWGFAQYIRGRGQYTSLSTARQAWATQYPASHHAAMAAQYSTPPGTYVPPQGPPIAPGDYDGDGIPDEFDPSHYI